MSIMIHSVAAEIEVHRGQHGQEGIRIKGYPALDPCLRWGGWYASAIGKREEQRGRSVILPLQAGTSRLVSGLLAVL